VEKSEPVTIKSLRASLGMNQEQFGQSLGLSKITISAYETGRLRPSTKTREKIQEVFHVTLAEDEPGPEDGLLGVQPGQACTLKQLRKSRRLSQAELAESLGLRVQTISAYERDKITPSRKVLDRIQEVYGVEIRSDRMDERDAKQKERLSAAQSRLGQNPTIAEIRTAKGLSQAEFARIIGVSAQAVSAYETGRMEPSRKTWEKIRSEFGVEHLDMRRMSMAQVLLENGEGKTVSLKQVLERIGLADEVTIWMNDQTAHWTRGEQSGSIPVYEDQENAE